MSFLIQRPAGCARSRTTALLAIAALLSGEGCCRPAPAGQSSSYVPRTRAITITTVPLLVKEQQAVFPFLTPAFGKGGVLEGKEVYAFSPSTITVVEGDTIHFTFINPEDDVHSFVLPDLAVPLPGNKTTEATYIARHAGIFPIVCAIASHLPMMSGQLVVLSAASMAGAARATAGPAARSGG
jgi:plastocyanin